MQIAVIGASGKTGSAVAELALDNGHPLRAVVRNPGSCVGLAHRGAEIVACDLDDRESLFSALTGVDAVYYCSPLPVGYDEPFAIERSRGRDLINAAKSGGTKHLVLLSAMGPETAPGVALIETKRAIEGDLETRKSDLRFALRQFILILLDHEYQNLSPSHLQRRRSIPA